MTTRVLVELLIKKMYTAKSRVKSGRGLVVDCI